MGKKCEKTFDLVRERNEHSGKLGEEVTAAIEQLLLDDVLDAARRQHIGGLLFHLLAEPCHSSIEMVQLQPLAVVIRHPGRTVTIRSRDEEPVESADEDRPFDRSDLSG
jgi:hypothetical protein